MSTRSPRKASSRPAHKNKPSHLGTKCVREKPVNHWGEKKRNITLSLTPTAIEAFDKAGAAENISISEILERLARCSPDLREWLRTIDGNQTNTAETSSETKA